MQHRIFLHALVTGVVATSGLSACGPVPMGATGSALTYSGSTSPVVVSTSNGDTVAGKAYFEHDAGGGMNAVGVVSTGSATASAPFSQLLPALAQNMTQESSGPPMLAGVVASVASDCDGSGGGANGGSKTTSYNGTSNSVTGSIAFDKFCHTTTTKGTLLNGTWSVALTRQTTDTATTVTMALTVTTFSVKGVGVDAALSGDMSTTVTTDTATSSAIGSSVLNMVGQNRLAGTMFKLENYRVDTAVDASSNATVSVSGRYYHSLHGYVDVSTPTVLAGPTTNAYPETGSIKFTGANSASITITATGAGNCRIDIDADGDGVVDQGGTINTTWATLAATA